MPSEVSALKTFSFDEFDGFATVQVSSHEVIMQAPVLAEKKVSKLSVFQVYGGLDNISGNHKPHFSITCGFETLAGKRSTSSFNRERILARFPEFEDLIALHLSDIDGLPLHAVKNGWYFLCGTVEGGHGAKFHAGNTAAPHSAADCVRILASHFRVSIEDATALCATITSEATLAEWVETQKPRYKREAEAAISHHGLQVFGEHYAPEAA